eukprot:CAMPEP_0177718120 /NCGR_PEP_ID=MMETSP0484_2-20121128/15410_1 /TAXON_ID=354590 /ORGANISM="Rhodomonas lens, Strain RHODO" /LENGTH=492 /DNA_ID=CAMNT_0019230269 /DNA_START=67 /DNA_END=1546 /DNA_ORIENTATION=-
MTRHSSTCRFLSLLLIAVAATAFHAPSPRLLTLRQNSAFLAPSFANQKWQPAGVRLAPRQQQKPLNVQAAIDVALLAPALAPAINAISGTATKLSGVAVLCGVVAFHEAGHFLAARLQGIRVNDFAIGFGPKLFSFKDKDGIEYSLRALPLGGYVSFPEAIPENEEDKEAREAKGEKEDEDEARYSEDDPDLIQNRPALQRAAVISGGVIFNLILTWLALFGTVTTTGVSNVSLNPGVLVPAIVDPSGAGAKYGLRSGDIILKVNDVTLEAKELASSDVSTAIKNSKGAMVHLEIEREKKVLALDVIPNIDRRGDGMIGVRLAPNVASVSILKPSTIPEAVGYANQQFASLLGQTVSGFGKLFSNIGQSAGNLAGPVGVMQMGAEAGKQGALLTFTAIISLNLGIMNALPLPALDGGQLLLVLVEAARGKPLNQEVTRSVNGAFLALLLGVSLTLLLGDIDASSRPPSSERAATCTSTQTLTRAGGRGDSVA